MASAMIDSVVFANNYSMPEVRQLFDDTTMVQNWLDIESALAQTQAEMGIIPQEAAERLFANATLEEAAINAPDAQVRASVARLAAELNVPFELVGADEEAM